METLPKWCNLIAQKIKIQGSKTALRDWKPKPRAYIRRFKARNSGPPPGKSLRAGFVETRTPCPQKRVEITLAGGHEEPCPRARTRPQGGDRKRSVRPGSSAELVHVSGSMAAHRSGPLKQQNKPHKGGRHRGRGSAQRDGKGKKVGLEE